MQMYFLIDGKNSLLKVHYKYTKFKTCMKVMRNGNFSHSMRLGFKTQNVHSPPFHMYKKGPIITKLNTHSSDNCSNNESNSNPEYTNEGTISNCCNAMYYFT